MAEFTHYIYIYVYTHHIWRPQGGSSHGAGPWATGLLYLLYPVRWRSTPAIRSHFQNGTIMLEQNIPVGVVFRADCILLCEARVIRTGHSISFKGTVSRDFLPPMFSLKLLLLVPLEKSRNDSVFFGYSQRYSIISAHHQCQ